MIGLKLLFVVLEILDLFLILLNLELELTLARFLLQRADLLLRQVLLLTHLCVKELLLKQLHLVEVIGFALFQFLHKLLLLL